MARYPQRSQELRKLSIEVYEALNEELPRLYVDRRISDAELKEIYNNLLGQLHFAGKGDGNHDDGESPSPGQLHRGRGRDGAER